MVFLEKTVGRVESILERLTTIVGIGKRPKSSVRYDLVVQFPTKRKGGTKRKAKRKAQVL